MRRTQADWRIGGFAIVRNLSRLIPGENRDRHEALGNVDWVSLQWSCEERSANLANLTARASD